MARRTQTYAIRLAVEGGGQVKAELVSVGQSGEQSLKRIESAGERASGGLKGLGRQAELLRTGIRTRSRAGPQHSTTDGAELEGANSLPIRVVNESYTIALLLKGRSGASTQGPVQVGQLEHRRSHLMAGERRHT